MKKTIYLFSNGELKRKDNTIYFENEEQGKKFIPVEDTSELMVFGEVDLNKRFLDFVSQNEIIIHYFNYYGYYSGTFYPREHLNSGFMILKQAENYLSDEKRVKIARGIFEGSVKNIIKVLSYYKNREKNVEEYIATIDDLYKSSLGFSEISQIMAIEGNIREQYYKSFDVILNDESFIFESRSRRPPKNPLNSLISFGNSLMYTTVLSEIYKTHLDPRIGYLHTTNFRRFSLNLDVAEIFKPIIIDRIIFKLINKNIIKAKHFEKNLEGVFLNEKGRALFVQEFDERLKTTIKHRELNKDVSYRRLIRLELYKLEKHFMGEKDYEPFIANW